MIFLKLGFRNILRNKKRSILGAFAVGLGLASLIIMDGFMVGMQESMIKLTTSSLLGEAQIHHQNFRDQGDAVLTIQNLDSLEEQLKTQGNIQAYSKRLISLGMVASPKSSRNTLIYGIEGEQEKKVNKLHKFITEGSFISSEKDLVIGTGLAKKLDARMGEKLIITTSEAESGEIAQEIFRVTGFIQFGAKSIDEGIVFIHRKKASELLKIGERVHEIVLKFDSLHTAGDKKMPLWKELSQGTNRAQSYRELEPGMDFMKEMVAMSTIIMGVILGVLVGLGIVNTLFMSIFERLFEFGVLRAIGTRTLDVFKMIIWESFFLGLLSIIFGFVISAIFGTYLGTVGIDYSGIEFNNITFREPIYYVFSLKQIWLFPLALLIFILIIAIYPARYASKLTLSEAMKKSL